MASRCDEKKSPALVYITGVAQDYEAIPALKGWTGEFVSAMR
jgi:hypothetical protein